MNETAAQMFEMRRAMQPYVGILYSLARWSPTGNILEIGVRQGQSTRAILGALSDRGSGRLVSIDLADRSERIPEQLKSLWLQIVGDSHSPDVREQVNVAANIRGQFDFILIDGDHSTEGVRKDYEDYAPFCRPGGVMVFHDTVNPEPGGGVMAFWESLSLPGMVKLDNWPGLGLIQKL